MPCKWPPSDGCPGSKPRLPPSRFAAAAGCLLQIVQQRSYFFLDGDDRLRLIQAAAQSGILMIGFGKFGLLGVRLNHFRPAMTRLQRAQGPRFTLAPPVAQGRGIQAFPAKNGRNAARIGDAVGLRV